MNDSLRAFRVSVYGLMHTAEASDVGDKVWGREHVSRCETLGVESIQMIGEMEKKRKQMKAGNKRKGHSTDRSLQIFTLTV